MTTWEFTPSRGSRGRRGLAMLAVGSLVLAGCATSGGAGTPVATPGSPSPDADPETDAESFADLPEITLRVQSANAPGTAPSRAFDAWKEAVETATDGRLQFEMYYAGGLVPLTEVEEGLESGLVDIATHVPAYSPARFVTDPFVQQLNSAVSPAPVGTLQGIGAQTEFFLDEDVQDEFTALGLKPLLVPAATISAMQLVCADAPVRTAEEARGIRVRVPSEHHGTEARALGMAPTATTNAELFEAMERGVVDCAVMSPQDVRDLGLLDVIGHWVHDPEVMFSGFSSFHLSMSHETWESLPVEAQRLLWDTAATVFLPTITSGYLEDAAETIKEAEERGIEFHHWEDDARQQLADHQDGVMGSLSDGAAGEPMVTRFVELHDQWLASLGDLGYGETLDSFAALAQAPTPIDLDAFIDRIVEIRAAHRP